MFKEPYQISLDSLQNGAVHRIDASFNPSFLGENEVELRFEREVEISGEIYLTDDDLIIHLSASTSVLMPCSICNKMIAAVLHIKDLYLAEPLKNISDAHYNFFEPVREALLIEIPKVIECGGNCAERAILAPYMHKSGKAEMKDTKKYYPFSNLKLP